MIQCKRTSSVRTALARHGVRFIVVAELPAVEAADRDSSILRLVPDMVMCSEVTEVVRGNVPLWVELYPPREAYSLVSIEGKRKEYGLTELSDLLLIVDQAKGLAR